MSFSKKLNAFLLQAKESKVINSDTCEDLQEFAIKNYSKSLVNNSINIIGFIGALAMIGGAILIISHNWWHIPNIVKILSYVFILILIHIAGDFFKESYPKISSILHFIGSGYILAGIGLMAQIYNLSSDDGGAFLLWFLMIAPMAIILKHRWIGVMSVLSFYLWVNIYLTSNGYYREFENIIFYFSIFGVNLILIPKLLNQINGCFDNIKATGASIIAIIVSVMGFAHEFSFEKVSFNWIIALISIFNIVAIFYLLLKEKKEKAPFKSGAILLILLTTVTLLPMIAEKGFFLISVLYWVLHFLLGAFLIYRGSLNTSSAYVNYGVWYIVIGIILRFVDLVGTMLFTGGMFILFGAILLSIAFAAEKFRKKLIIKIQKSNV
jgi:uncharacterized membrane protein